MRGQDRIGDLEVLLGWRADEVAAKRGALRGARVEGGGSLGSLAFTRACAGLPASLVRLCCRDDRLQSGEMPAQGSAAWLGEGDLPARTRVCPDAGDLHVTGFGEC